MGRNNGNKRMFSAGARRLSAAAPAALALAVMLCLGLAVIVATPARGEIERRADAAIARRDYAAARIWFMRLLRDDPANSRYISGLKISERYLDLKTGAQPKPAVTQAP